MSGQNKQFCVQNRDRGERERNIKATEDAPSYSML